MAKAWLDAGEAVLVDVRDPDEYAFEHIPGSRLMPLSGLKPESLATLGCRRVIMQCRSGQRGAEAVRLCRNAPGVVEVLNLARGIEAWKHAGLPVERSGSGPRISVMRQTQMVIGAGVLAGTVVAYLVSPLGLLLTAFFGAGLLVAGLTGTCGLAAVLSRMPWNRAASCSRECRSGPCSGSDTGSN
jgi:rhodanese-related sulfurtransferase